MELKRLCNNVADVLDRYDINHTEGSVMDLVERWCHQQGGSAPTPA